MIYHIKPADVKGETLMPLNKIKQLDKAVYESKVKKYNGREVLLECIIPKLNCLWNDVLFFSPVHPQKIKDLRDELNLKWNLFNWYELNPNDIPDFAKNTVIYDSEEKQKGDFSIDEKEIIPFSLDELEKLREIPEATKRHYKIMNALGEPIFIFYQIPHILYKGSIPVSKLKSFTIDA